MSSALGTGINEGGGSSSLYMQYPHQRAFGLLHDPGAVIARAGPAACDSSVASCDRRSADRAFSGGGAKGSTLPGGQRPNEVGVAVEVGSLPIAHREVEPT